MPSSPPSPPTRARGRRLSTADYQALGAFRAALRKFLAFSEAAAREQDLTPQQHQALLAVRAHAGAEAMSVGELARSLLVKTHSAVGLVTRLEDRGLVVRQSSAADRRRILLLLTPEAERRLEAISRANLGELNWASDIFRELMGTLRELDAGGLWTGTDPSPPPS